MLPSFALALLILNAAAAAPTARNPQPNEPIAIIGAGLSGVFSAYHLASAGHTNITIYEATTRPGGYINSVRYKNVTYDMGPYAISPTFWKFKAAAESLGFSFCPFEGAVILATSPPTVLDNVTFQASVSAPALPDPSQYPTLLREQINRYTQIWSILIKLPFLNERLETDRLFPTRPANEEKLRRLSVPMLEFLRRENLELLIPFMRMITDTQAFGPIETTAALYYLTWATPSFFLPTAQVYVPCDIGFGDIHHTMLNRLLRTGKVHVQYGSPVTQVKRGRKFARVVTADGSVDMFSTVIVTSKLQNKIRKNVVTPLTPREKRASRKMEDLELYTVMLEGSRETAVANDFLINLVAKPLSESRPNTAFWSALVQELRSPDGPFTSDMSTIVKTAALLSYRERAMREGFRLSRSRAVRMVLNGMKKFDSTVWRAIQGYRYQNYFQRWRPAQVREGLPWVLEESQGIGKVYYVNSAACGHENVGHIFECSERVSKRIRNHA